MNRSTLSLRPYIESIEELCRSLDRDALQQCILALAKQVQPADRQVFLQNLRAVSPENEHRQVAVALLEETFLQSEIENLRQEMGSRLASLAETSSWDDPGDDERSSWPDGDPELVN